MKKFRDMTPGELDEAEAQYNAMLKGVETVKAQLTDTVKQRDIDARVQELKDATKPFITFAETMMEARIHTGLPGIDNDTPMLQATSRTKQTIVLWKSFMDLLFAVQKDHPSL